MNRNFRRETAPAQPEERPPSEAWLFAQAILGKPIPNPAAAASKAHTDRERLEWLAAISTEHRKHLAILERAEADARREREQLEWLAAISTEHEDKLRSILRREAEALERQERLEQLAEFSTLDEAEWNPEKHPRGGYSQNRGWWSPSSGMSKLLLVSDKTRTQGNQPKTKLPPISVGTGSIQKALAEEKAGTDERRLNELVDLLKAGGAKFQNGPLFVGSVKHGKSLFGAYIAVLQLDSPGSTSPIIAERAHTTMYVSDTGGKLQAAEETVRVLELFPTDASGKATLTDPVALGVPIPYMKDNRLIVAQYDRHEVTFSSGTTGISKRPTKEWKNGFKAWRIKDGEDAKIAADGRKTTLTIESLFSQHGVYYKGKTSAGGTPFDVEKFVGDKEELKQELMRLRQ